MLGQNQVEYNYYSTEFVDSASHYKVTFVIVTFDTFPTTNLPSVSQMTVEFILMISNYDM